MVLIILRETKGEKFMHLHYTHKRDYIPLPLLLWKQQLCKRKGDFMCLWASTIIIRPPIYFTKKLRWLLCVCTWIWMNMQQKRKSFLVRDFCVHFILQKAAQKQYKAIKKISFSFTCRFTFFLCTSVILVCVYIMTMIVCCEQQRIIKEGKEKATWKFLAAFNILREDVCVCVLHLNEYGGDYGYKVKENKIFPMGNFSSFIHRLAEWVIWAQRLCSGYWNWIFSYRYAFKRVFLMAKKRWMNVISHIEWHAVIHQQKENFSLTK